jgi:hypothetical protein
VLTPAVFKKRDPEGKFIINNVLMNGHVHMLEYLLSEWAEPQCNLPLTLEHQTTVIHQALAMAAFVEPDCYSQQKEQVAENGSENKEDDESNPRQSKRVTESALIKMLRLLVEHSESLQGAGIDISS